MNKMQQSTSGSITPKKNVLRTQVLKQLFLNNELSHTQLKYLLGISLPTTITLVNELLQEQIIEQRGKGVSNGGRRPELYAIRTGTIYVMAINIERFSATIAIMDSNYSIVNTSMTFPYKIDEENALEILCQKVNESMQASPIDNSKIIGIGITMPGLVDATKGITHSYLQPKNGQSLKDYLQNKLGKPIVIQNDVKSSAIAELRCGLAKGKKNVLVLLMDWGVGLGIILGGKVQSGNSGFSGELGHIPFIDDGRLCYCGKKGCLETVASGIAMARMAKEGINSGQNSLLNQLGGREIDKIEPQYIIDAANKGDQYAITILADIGFNMGKAIATLVQLFNPELIILGGKISEAKQYITVPMQYSLNKYSMIQISEQANIVLSNLSASAPLIGITSSVIENILQEEINNLEKQ